MNTPIELTLNEYQQRAATTAIYPGRGTALGLMYCALKLNGEAGEVAENVGKAIRDDGLCEVKDTDSSGASVILGVTLTAERRQKIKKELGDGLWYIANAAKELGFSLAEIAGDNLAKLADRQARGVLQGSGDNR